eukprot:TRINITY_DN15383_c0_g1_i2.p1 TRINITY_DN15383_c0_g1~~TRINITY_DN15383_c0_g1_i2.p1  ORF type:complete len:304 (-),score=51.28 TRINITY_DN15383_c0_g1_i2:164-1075(-)
MTRVASLLINQHALLLGFAVKNTLRGSRVTRVSMSVVASAPTEVPSKFLKNKRLVPESTPPSDPDLGLLYNFVNDSKKLVVLTGAGASTECGIPDYRSPHGAYSSGFKPITHQEFVRSEKARRRYWARSYAGWQKFNSVQPGATHKALANLEKKGRVYGMITQNVDRLHQKAGSNPIELHGTTHYVVCLSCGCITDRHLFQDRVKALNPEVVFFGDNVPRERANQAFSIVKEGDALLVVGSSLNTMSAYRLVNAARENCLPIAILNIGQTRADKLSTIKVEAHCGEALSRLLSMGSLAVPLIK